MHLAIATCPNIAFTVAMVAQFGNDPGPVHWDAVKQIFRYLMLRLSMPNIVPTDFVVSFLSFLSYQINL